jgi:hypothetical protein
MPSHWCVERSYDQSRDKETLREAADKLRAQMDAAEYKVPPMGLIFLKYVSDAVEERREEVAELLAEGRRPKLEYGREIKSNKTLIPRGCILLSKLNPHIPRVWLPDVKN